MSGFGLSNLLLTASQKNPEKSAFSFEDQHFSFAALHTLASRVAGFLRSTGLRPDDRVVIWSRKRLEYVTAIYGSLYAGGCYVPVDQACPAYRAGFIVRSVEPHAIIGEHSLIKTIVSFHEPSSANDGNVLLVILKPGSELQRLEAQIVLEWSDLNGVDPPPGPIDAEGDRLAYILFTSGSTGEPKGVVHTHKSALEFILWSAKATGLRADDVLSQYSCLSFDLSIFDLFSGVSAEARTVIVPEWMYGRIGSLARLIAKEGITVWYSVPSAFLQSGQAGLERLASTSLRCIVFAGEQIPKAPLGRLMAALPPACQVMNWYGPTETNVCLHHSISEAALATNDPIPIGAPCPHARTILADRCAPGDEDAVGELLVNSATNMIGYWKLDALTRKAFSKSSDGTPYYKTGDIVGVSDGRYTLKGRTDRQLKIRGYRVQPDEVEAVIEQVPGVLEAAVVGLYLDGGEDLASLIASDTGRADTIADVRAHCAARLPKYMVPSICLRVDSIPKGDRGKTDYDAVRQIIVRDLAGC